MIKIKKLKNNYWYIGLSVLYPKKLPQYAYIFLTSVIMFGVVAKVFYDIGVDMQTYAYAEQHGFVSPVPSPTPTPTLIIQTLEIKSENQDTWIREAAQKYATHDKPESYLKYQLHCLANKESGHHATDKCGDGGVSCGMYQWREPSWKIVRSEMKSAQLIQDLGSLWDDKSAIETTAYALTHGYDMWWGPITRGDCQ